MTRLLLLAALAVLSSPWNGKPPTHGVAPSRLPVAWVHRASADERLAAGKPNWTRAFELVAPNLDPKERGELGTLLENEQSRLETKLNPLVTDLLDEEEPKSALSGWARAHAPVFQSALALSTSILAVDDGKVATLVDRCDADACVSLGGAPTDDAVARRARFVAWPFAAGVVVRAPDAAVRACALGALRSRVREAKLVAIVVAGEEPAPMTDAERTRVERVLFLEAVDGASSKKGATVEAPRAPPPLALDATELLVVPRLAALTSLDAFHDIVTTTARACTRNGSADGVTLLSADGSL